MQRTISNKVKLGDTLNPLKGYGGVPDVDDEANLEILYGKIDKIGRADESLARYLPNLTPVSRQNQTAGSIPRRAFASVTYSDGKILEYILELTPNTYSNYSSMELVLPIQFTKSTNKTAKMAADLITANILFGHLIKDIDIRRYPDDTRILPTNNNVDVYQYSASQVKYLRKNVISVVEKTLLYSKKPVYLDENVDRRYNNSADATKRTDDNLDYRIGEFKDYLFFKKVLPYSLRIFSRFRST